MARSVTILGTVHEIQGAENSPRKKVEDPFFLTLVDHFLRGKDFAFEEASENGPTKLERRTEQFLGIGHYMDVDPHRDKRAALGIGITGDPHLVNPMGQFSDAYCEEFESEHSEREEHWLRRIISRNFEAALFICGFLHTLSMAGRLRKAGFDVETWTYVPYSQLCPRAQTRGQHQNGTVRAIRHRAR